MSSQAWPRSAAPHCSLPREVGSQGSALRAFALAPKVGGILLPPPMRGLLAAPVRLRRPYIKENYSPRALQRTEFIIYRFCSRSPAYSAESARGAGLSLIMLNCIYAGGPVLIKNHPGVRCCIRRGGLFCDLLVATGREQKTAKTVRKGQAGSVWPRDGRRTRPGPTYCYVILKLLLTRYLLKYNFIIGGKLSRSNLEAI